MPDVVGWCKQHLNWTATLGSMSAIVYSYVTIEFFRYIGMPPFGLYSGDLDAILIESNCLSTLLFAWVLREKKRSLWFLLFFTPAFIPYFFILGLLIGSFPFMLTGFIIVLALKKR